MAITDTMGRPVLSVMVYNRTDLAEFKGECSNVTIQESFPFVGLIEVGPGEVAEVPIEVAERWCDPERWNRQAGWPVSRISGKVIPPITKAIPASKASPEEGDAPPPKTAGSPVGTPKK